MSSKIRGCESTNRDSICGKLVQWIEVSPLELKLTIEDEMTLEDKKVDYDKENECSICCSDLYENLREMSVEDAIGFQKKILSGHEMMNVVRMGNC